MKPGIIVLIAILIASFGGFLFLSQSPKSPDNPTSTQTQPEDQVTIQNSVDVSSNLEVGSDSSQNMGGNYITDWNADTYSNSTADKIVLFFYASWCPTCRPIDTEFKSGKIPDGIEIYRVNYNDPETDEDEKALAQKYGITYQHTFVQVDKNGNEITKWNGGGLDKLLSSIK